MWGEGPTASLAYEIPFFIKRPLCISTVPASFLPFPPSNSSYTVLPQPHPEQYVISVQKYIWYTLIYAYICSNIYIRTYALLEWLTVCSPASPKWLSAKVQESINHSVLKPRFLSWSSVYARVPKKWALMPAVDLPNGVKASSKEKKVPFFYAFI